MVSASQKTPSPNPNIHNAVEQTGPEQIAATDDEAPAAPYHPDADDELSNSRPGATPPEELNFIDLTGQSIGHYLVEKRLGGGAASAVFRATDKILERTVALKVLLPGADHVMRERFRREARTASVLEHPHIVHTYQVGQTAGNGIVYIAMELVTGESLGALLEHHGRLSVVDACRLLEPIARALHYAHSKAIVHRDVKPSNILLRQVTPGTPHSVQISVLNYSVVPLLSDFGIARALDAPELTSAGRTIGTPAFMSPEQCAGNSAIDGRADIYSLGTVLYRCLVGRAPFVGTTTQVLHAHVYEPLTIPDNVARELPAFVIHILQRSLMKEPGQRYSDAQAMADDLAAVARGDEGAQKQPTHGDLDSTQTMPALPTTRPSTGPTSSRILVPTPAGSAKSISSRGKQIPMAPSAGKKSPAIPPMPPIPARRVKTGRTGMLALSATLIILVAALGLILFNSVLWTGSPNSEAPQPITSTPRSTPLAPTPSATVSAKTPAGAMATPTPINTLPPAENILSSAPATITPTPAKAPTPAASLQSAWDDAQAFYAEGDWEEALLWLTLVRRIDEQFEQERVNEMFFFTYIGVASLRTAAGKMQEAVRYYEKALELRSAAPSIVALRDATVDYRNATASERTLAAEKLQQAHVAYAEELALYEDFCGAAGHLATALAIQADEEAANQQARYQEKCAGGKAREELPQLNKLTGNLLYSAQQGGHYRIYRVPATLDATSTLLVDNAAQPGLRPDGLRLAFYSTRADMRGLAGFDLAASLDPNARTIQYTNFAEDARDSAPGWNSQGDRLVYASTNYGDGRSRIYLTWADGSRNTVTLGYGKDPAWHPKQDWIVYNGMDETGNRPGLWLARPDGSERKRLTDNGNDQRPTWSPDGRYVVFMSNGRDGNWELYRVSIGDQAITRLTDHFAQDGLPAVSPNGAHIAYMSDRDGFWRIWVVSMEGGASQPLVRITGELPRWLEHGLQWVR